MLGSFLWKSDRVNMVNWMNDWMNACMDWLLFVCVIVYVCVCGWVVRSTCLQGGAVYITDGEGTFTNCNFTSNEARVSLEEEHVDGCVWDVWVHDAVVVPFMYISFWLTHSFAFTNWLLFLCVCVYVCMCMWWVRSTCLQGGAVYVTERGSSGTFTNCNFNSNEAVVSLEEEHFDSCEMPECMTLRFCCLQTSTDWFLLPLSFHFARRVIVSDDRRSNSHSLSCLSLFYYALCTYKWMHRNL